MHAEIQSLDVKEEGGHLSPVERENTIILQEQLCMVILQDEIKWKQCLRNKWLKGDCNTRFFHATSSAHHRV